MVSWRDYDSQRAWCRFDVIDQGRLPHSKDARSPLSTTMPAAALNRAEHLESALATAEACYRRLFESATSTGVKTLNMRQATVPFEEHG